MTTEKGIFFQVINRVFLFLLGIVLFCIPSDVSYAEEVSGLTVISFWWGDENEGTLEHKVQNEVTAVCSVFDITALGFCYHELDEDGNLQEYRLNAENLAITRNGEPANDYVDVANYPDDLRNVRLRFKQPGDYIISSAVEGQEDSFVTIHVPEPSTGFFTEPQCSNKNRTHFYPYDDKNVIYFILPENTKLNENASFLNGYPIDILIYTKDGMQNVPQDVIQQYVSYEVLEENSRVCKLTFDVDKLDTVDYCKLYIYYESTDGSFEEIRSNYLYVGSSEDDRIGLSFVCGATQSAFDGTIEKIVKKEMTVYTNASGRAAYDFAFYDYNEKDDLVEISPKLENIRIIKDGVDVTEEVSLWQNSYGDYEITFQKSGKYRVVVTLENGKEDAVDFYVENHLYGFYSTPVVDVYELTKFELKMRNKVVYYILSDYMKLNNKEDVNGGVPFAISINGSKISQELQAEYFSYELVEGTENVYKITFQTDKTKEELSEFGLYVYYEDTETAEIKMDYLFVSNEIPEESTTEETTTEEPSIEELPSEEPTTEVISGLTVSTYWSVEEGTNEIIHTTGKEATAICSVIDMTRLYLCYHQYTDDGYLVEHPLKRENLVITRNGEDASAYVEVGNYPFFPEGVNFRFKEPGDYVISSSIEGQDDTVMIHVPEPTSGFFTEPECSNRNRTHFYPYQDNNTIYCIIPENAKLVESTDSDGVFPIQVCTVKDYIYTQVSKEEIDQVLTYELLEGTSNVYKVTLNVEILEEVDFYDIWFYYESEDDSIDNISSNHLCVGCEKSDRIGLWISSYSEVDEFDGEIMNAMQKELSIDIGAENLISTYRLVYYDYNEDDALVEIVPDLEDIRIMKQGVDVTEQTNIHRNYNDDYEISFEHSGIYTLVVTLEDGREDAVYLHAERTMYGFFESVSLTGNALTHYNLTQSNNEVYYVLSDRMKINENSGVNGGNPFAILINGNKVSSDLASQYFSYELVEGTSDLYKIIFTTDKLKEDVSKFDLYVYYEYIDTGAKDIDILYVASEITAVGQPAEEPTTEETPKEEPTTEIPPIGGMVGEQETVLLISDVVINPIGTQTYRDKAIEPVVSVTHQGKQLIRGHDYTVEYKNNTSVGTADIILTGIGDYTGTKKLHFQIEPYKVKGLSEILKGKDGKIYRATYNGKKIMLKTAFKLSYMDGMEKGYLEPQEGTDYSVQYENNKKIGMARIVYTFKGNYTGTVVKKFVIVPPITQITKIKKSGKTLVIHWKKVSSADQYEVYRATSKKGKYKKIATVKGKNKVSYKDKKAKKGKKYYYKVVVCKKVSGTLYKSGLSDAKKGIR